MRYSLWSAVLGAVGEDDWKALGGAGGGGGAGSGEFCDSSLITGGELGASVVTGEDGGAAATAASEGAPAAGRDPGGGCGPPGRPDSLLPILMTVSMSVHICKGRSVEAGEKAEAAVDHRRRWRMLFLSSGVTGDSYLMQLSHFSVSCPRRR